MIIEWLKFRVSPDIREKFLAVDQQIWTNQLQNYPGFLGKEIWFHPQRVDEIVFIIRWQTREQWKNIPQVQLDKIDREFAQQMQSKQYQMIESIEYQVQNLP